MKMKISHIALVILALAGSSVSLFGQGIYFDPTPTDVTVPARFYVDVTSPECNCPELLDVNPTDNPLYIWTWDPKTHAAGKWH